MIEVADIFRCHGRAYAQTHYLLPSQRRALEDLQRCRTAACGGHLYECDRCGYLHYRYHSCRNRHCPKCHGEQTQRWSQKQRQRLLSCSYYLLTFTLPAGLRSLAYGHQQTLYSLLLRSAAAALQKLAWDAKYVGGRLAMLAMLHTWTRTLLDHPHAHLLVSAGGLSAAGQHWVNPKNPAFLVPCFALSKIFRGKFKAGLKRAGLLGQVPAGVWQQNWVVHCRHAGSGEKALDYLGRYVFRIAITNSRIEAFQNGQVTFRYRDNRTQQLQRVTLSAEEFIRRFLRHVLPKGFVKVRGYGLWSAQATADLQKARTLLAPAQAPPTTSQMTPPVSVPQDPALNRLPLCPQCKLGHLVWVQALSPQRTRGP